MIRRLKKDVQKDLPPANDITRFHKLSPKAMKIYDKILMGIWEIMDEWNPEEAGQEKTITHMLAQIIRLKQVCAIDKAEMVADLATDIRDNEPEDEPNPKVLVFSQFVAVAKAIHKRLNDGGRSRMFSGQDSPDERMKFVDQFQNDPKVDYLVMTSKVAAEGLTLTKASTIIFADLFWTPKDHEQCVGRAYGRLNDAHPVDVYWCIADNTIEDWINDLLAQKRALIGQVVDGKEIVGDESVASELIKKMRAEMFNRKKK
jgi:SNF2 family DNA or RNA helicase